MTWVSFCAVCWKLSSSACPRKLCIQNRHYRRRRNLQEKRSDNLCKAMCLSLLHPGFNSMSLSSGRRYRLRCQESS